MSWAQACSQAATMLTTWAQIPASAVLTVWAQLWLAQPWQHLAQPHPAKQAATSLEMRCSLLWAGDWQGLLYQQCLTWLLYTYVSSSKCHIQVTMPSTCDLQKIFGEMQQMAAVLTLRLILVVWLQWMSVHKKRLGLLLKTHWKRLFQRLFNVN